MRVAIWTNYPNHYQFAFHRALREVDVDLRVRYYEPLPPERLAMGWGSEKQLPADDRVVDQGESLDQMLSDWRERVHILPGYGGAFLLNLCKTLVRERAMWAHWSEQSRPGLRRIASWAIKRWYAQQVNQHALGAFGIGNAALRDFARWGIRAEKLELLPYSAPIYTDSTEPDEQCMHFRHGRFAFGFIGSLEQRKAVDVMIRAIGNLSDRRAVLLLVGNDESSGRYAQLTSQLGVADRVFFRGPTSPDRIASMIASFDVAMLPSRFDGWGVALNEAALMGKPLIASDRVGAAEHLIEHGRNGFVVRAGDVRSLADAMHNYLANPALAREHGQRSREIAADFTPQRNVQRFVHAIESWRASSSAR